MKNEDWIACSERLPNEHNFYMITVLNKSSKDRYTTKEHWQGEWTNNENRNFEIIAWMPLPEPYKEDL